MFFRSAALRATTIGSLVFIFGVAGYSAELKKETLDAWNVYLRQESHAVQTRADGHEGFLWLDQDADRFEKVHSGVVVVAPMGEHNPERVPNGLIHHWIGAAYIPHASAQDVLSVTRDYADYKDYYKPAVGDAKPVSLSDDEDKYTICFVNNSIISKSALEGSYVTDYIRIDKYRWYSVSKTTQMSEIKDFQRPTEERLPPDSGSGYIWRLFSTTRLEEYEGGVFVEIEAVALSRDVPGSLHWIVDPIIRRISRDSLEKSLRETAEAVRTHTESIAQNSR